MRQNIFFDYCIQFIVQLFFEIAQFVAFCAFAYAVVANVVYGAFEVFFVSPCKDDEQGCDEHIGYGYPYIGHTAAYYKCDDAHQRESKQCTDGKEECALKHVVFTEFLEDGHIYCVYGPSRDERYKPQGRYEHLTY